MGKNRLRLLLVSTLLGCLLLPSPLPALGFPEILARFREISPPAIIDLSGGFRFADAGSIPIADFKRLFLEPGLRLSGRRPDLRSLDDWSARFRGTESHTTIAEDEDWDQSIVPCGRWTAGGFVILALRAGSAHGWVDGGESWDETFLFSLTPEGRLIDGMSPRSSLSLDLDASVPSIESTRSALVDPVLHQGGYLGASLALDTTRNIIVIERYGIEGLVAEIALKAVALSKPGQFTNAAPARRFLLSRVFVEGEGSAGELSLFESAEGAAAGPLFLRWLGSKDGKSPALEAELPSGPAPGRSIGAACLSGQALTLALSADGREATLTDASGAAHSLTLAFGPGDRGEGTVVSGSQRLGDIYVPKTRDWRYLFTPALLPAAGGDRALFAAHSFAIGTTRPAPDGDDRHAAPPADESVAIGSLAGESRVRVGGAERRLAPGSLRFFADDEAIGRFSENVEFAGPAGTILLPAGSAYDALRGSGMLWVAVPAGETSIRVGAETLKIPAGSRMEFNSIDVVEKISFATPVALRVGSATVPIYVAVFDGDTGRLKEAYPVEAKETGPMSRIVFNEAGKVRDGFLHGEGRTGRAMLFFDDGRPRNGQLLVTALFETAASSLRLLPGDSITFRKDGSLESCEPRAMLIFSRGDRNFLRRLPSLGIAPDGSLAPASIPPELTAVAGTIIVRPLQAVCDDTRVRVRSQPDLQGAVLGYLDAGDALLVLDMGAQKVKVEDMTDFWYRVLRLSDGLEGWSYGHYLQLRK